MNRGNTGGKLLKYVSDALYFIFNNVELYSCAEVTLSHPSLDHCEIVKLSTVELSVVKPLRMQAIFRQVIRTAERGKISLAISISLGTILVFDLLWIILYFSSSTVTRQFASVEKRI